MCAHGCVRKVRMDFHEHSLGQRSVIYHMLYVLGCVVPMCFDGADFL
jgi:hypothetical protein